LKAVFDHNLPKRFRQLLPGHDIATAREMGWEALGNGKLLRAAADSGFEAFVAVDKKIEHEQNLKTLPLPVIVLDARTNSFEGVQPFAPFVLRVLDNPLSNRLYLIEITGNVLELIAPRRKT
jgi:hypothetical protein